MISLKVTDRASFLPSGALGFVACSKRRNRERCDRYPLPGQADSSSFACGLHWTEEAGRDPSGRQVSQQLITLFPPQYTWLTEPRSLARLQGLTSPTRLMAQVKQ